MQKQPSRGVLRKICSENVLQIYRRKPMPKCDFNKIALQLYWNRTSAWMFPCILATYFQSTFSFEHLWTTAFVNVYEIHLFILCFMLFYVLSANPIKWSNTLKQFVGNLPANCLSVFDHFVKLALKRLCRLVTSTQLDFRKISLNNQKHEFTKHEKQLFLRYLPMEDFIQTIIQ